jgi:hypothetical protein
MYKDLVHISKAQGIYRTLALWTILSPKLAGNESRKHLSQEDVVNKPGEQAYTAGTDKKVECLSSSK